MKSQAELLKQIIKDKGSWDGCDVIEITDYCVGCKYEEYCRRLLNG
ncbi:MAG: hypothetical protein JW901_05355 [Dehalococcoidia bacterium]|nr:hypothetical protein [Dehalococcoidia bacterium]